MSLVNRDPFAREELHKHRVHATESYAVASGCMWCGTIKRTPSGRAYLFRYSVETDSGRTYDDRDLFCSVGCRRTFNS